MPLISRRFAIVTLASQAALAADGALEGEPDHAGHPTQIVGIVSTRLLPTVLVVPHDSAFGWLNYSSEEATIKFEEDITPKLTCRSPGQIADRENRRRAIPRLRRAFPSRAG